MSRWTACDAAQATKAKAAARLSVGIILSSWNLAFGVWALNGCYSIKEQGLDYDAVRQNN